MVGFLVVVAVVVGAVGWTYTQERDRLRTVAINLGLPPVLVGVPCDATERTGGFEFSVLCSARADVFFERHTSESLRREVSTKTDQVVAEVEASMGRSFVQRPRLYVFGSSQSFAYALSSVFDYPRDVGLDEGAHAAAVYLRDYARIVVNGGKPDAMEGTLAHELTHLLSASLSSHATSAPSWFEEGLATLNESASMPAEDRRYRQWRVASMANVGRLPSLNDLADRESWRTAVRASGGLEYDVAAEAVSMLRTDLGSDGIAKLLEELGRGSTFEQAYETVSEKSFSSFASDFVGRAGRLFVGMPAVRGSNQEGRLYIVLIGYRPGLKVKVDITGGGDEASEEAVIEPTGMYTTFLGLSWPTGIYHVVVRSTQGVQSARLTKN